MSAVTGEQDFCPYVGLQPFREEDRDYFFGRSRDQRVVISNLYASHLTVLYGPSGVGKSSILRAGVVPQLRTSPNTAVVVFSDWAHPRFQDELKRACLDAMARVKPDALRGAQNHPARHSRPIRGVLSLSSRVGTGHLV